MNTTDATYKVLKLLNGEELICELGYGEIEDSYEMLHPLKMQVESKVTKQGPVDSLNLSRWIVPYTEQSLFSIKSDHVLLVTNASPGLCRYYDHVIREIDNLDNSKETREALDNIKDEDIYDELLEELETDNTIH